MKNRGQIGGKQTGYVAKAGSVKVPVQVESDGEGGRKFRVTWQSPDRPGRQRKKFADFESAKAFAIAKAETISKVGGAVFTLTDAENTVAGQLCSLAGQYGLTLESLFWEFREAKALAGGKSLVEIVREHAKIRPPDLNPISVKDAVTEYLAAKAGAEKSERHIRDITEKLEKFRGSFTGNLSEVTVPLLQAWITKLDVGARTKRNYMRTIGGMFNYGLKRKWLAAGSVDLSLVETGREELPEVGIFTPDELHALIANCREEMLPFLLIGAWAGLRHSETKRISWAQVRFDTDDGYPNGWIEVRADQAKNAAALRGRARRLIPMTKALHDALKPLARPGQPVCGFKKTENQLRTLVRASGVKWKNNALRHSFGSYRLALIRSQETLALEMGNSPAVIFRHYRQLVTPGEAGRWFAKPMGTSRLIFPTP